MNTLSSIDARAFRSTIGLFATGVTVITTRSGAEAYGMTANAIASLSLDPMLLLVSVGKKHAWRHCCTLRHLHRQHPARDQEALSTFFAGSWKEPDPPPFTFLPWEEHPELDCVRLDNVLGSIGCRVTDIVEGGDHWIVIGQVLALSQGAEPRNPLLFYAGRYWQLGATTVHPAPARRPVNAHPPCPADRPGCRRWVPSLFSTQHAGFHTAPRGDTATRGM
ncbi:MAG: flavin reductase [Anaerolineae bacterium]|nr:MAG: flavin reductase [Anaerolineae bacterium]